MLLSVCCIAYNQEEYIAETIEGFLIQKATFPFEIIIHDDASNDNTTNIIKEYALKYPNLIFPIFQVENQYSKGINPAYEFVVPKCKGKYIAVCEGDDYWTDPYKLQKQVDILESNTDYGLVHTDADFLINNKQVVPSYFKYNGILHSEIVTVADIITRRYPIIVCTICLRKEITNLFIEDENYKGFKMGDYPLLCEAASKWKFKYINDSTAVRRILNDSASHSTDYNKQLTFINAGKEAADYLIKKFICTPDTSKYIKIKTLKARIKLDFEFYKSKDLKSSISELNKIGYKLSAKEKIYYFSSINKLIHLIILYLIKLYRKI